MSHVFLLGGGAAEAVSRRLTCRTASAPGVEVREGRIEPRLTEGRAASDLERAMPLPY